MLHAVRVRVDDDRHAGLGRAPHVLVAEIEPVGVGVELEHGAGLPGRGNDRLDVDLVGLALLDQPAGGVEEDVGVRVPHGADDPVGLLPAREVEVRVDRDADHVELGERLVVDVERAVPVDVDLGAGEQADAVELGVEALDLAPLAAELPRVTAARHGEAHGVVGDGDVCEARFLRGARHRLQRVGAVGPVGLRLEVAAEIARLDQARERARARRLDLALVLAQLGRDPGEAEAVVELLLGAARDPPRAAKEAVFVQLPALLHGQLAERDVVRLAPREVEERGAEALLGDDAHIDLEPVLQLHAALRVPLAEDARHRRQLREGGDRRLGRAREGEEIGVADGLLAAADRARDLDARHARHARERRRQLVDHGAHGGERRALPARLHEGERLQDLLLALLAEVGEVADLAGARRGFEVGERAHAEPLVEELHGLRPHALERGQRGQVDGHAAVVLLAQLALAGRDQLLQLLGHRGADAGDLAQRLHAAGTVDRVERPVVRLDRLRRLLVGARLEGHVVHVEVGGDVPEDARQLGVAHSTSGLARPRAGRQAPAGAAGRGAPDHGTPPGGPSRATPASGDTFAS